MTCDSVYNEAKSCAREAIATHVWQVMGELLHRCEDEVLNHSHLKKYIHLAIYITFLDTAKVQDAYEAQIANYQLPDVTTTMFPFFLNLFLFDGFGELYSFMMQAPMALMADVTEGEHLPVSPILCSQHRES